MKALLTILLGLVTIPLLVQGQTPANDLNWNTTNLLLNDDFAGTTSFDVSTWQLGWGWDDRDLCHLKVFNIEQVAGNPLRLRLHTEGHLYATGHQIALQGVNDGTGGVVTSPSINGTVFTLVAASSTGTTGTMEFLVSAVTSCNYDTGGNPGCVMTNQFAYHVWDHVTITQTGPVLGVWTVTVQSSHRPHMLSVGDKVALSGVTFLTTTPAINGTLHTITATPTANSFRFEVTNLSVTGSSNTNARVFFMKNVYLDGNSNLVLKSDYKSSRTLVDMNRTIHTGAISTVSGDYHYGFYEIRCKLNATGKRFNSAFWVFGVTDDNCTAPAWETHENDFFEAYENESGTKIDLSNNIHKSTYAGGCGADVLSGFHHHHLFSPSELRNNFHVFGYEWTPSRNRHYYDGVQYDELYSSSVPSISGRLIANLGLFDDIPAPLQMGTNSPNYENYMTIDYIKVYELKQNCIAQTVSNFNSSTFSFGVRNSLTLNGTFTTAAGYPAVLRANSFLLDNFFTAAAGNAFMLLPTECP